MSHSKMYTHIKRIAYGCKSEAFFLEKDKEYWQKVFSSGVMTYDSTIDHKTKYTAGKASYIERNQAMIDNSDFCIFYYNEDYLPEKRKKQKNTQAYINHKVEQGLHICML